MSERARGLSRAFPQPAYPPNTPVAELLTAELAVVAVLRLWVAPYRNPQQHHPHWRDGIEAAGLEDDGAPAFAALMRIVATSAQRLLDVRCVRCPNLGEDEAWMLQLISLIQRGEAGDAAMILSDWLPPAAAKVALPYAIVFATAMANRRLIVPHRPATAFTHRLVRGERDTLALVH